MALTTKMQENPKQIRRPSTAKPIIRPFSAHVKKFPPVDEIAAERPRTSGGFGSARNRGWIQAPPVNTIASPRHVTVQKKFEFIENNIPLPSTESLITIFQAKCSQLRIQPTMERQDRFIELVHKHSVGGKYVRY